MNSYSIEIKKEDLDRLYNKLTAIQRENVIQESLSEATITLANWSSRRRFRSLNMNRKIVHPTMLTARTPGGYKDRIFGQTPSEVRKEGDTFTAYFGTNIKNKGFSYPRLHEFGGRHHSPRPVLTPAIQDNQNRQNILNIFTRRINKALEKK